jgi:hypothetical protein
MANRFLSGKTEAVAAFLFRAVRYLNFSICRAFNHLRFFRRTWDLPSATFDQQGFLGAAGPHRLDRGGFQRATPFPATNHPAKPATIVAAVGACKKNLPSRVQIMTESGLVPTYGGMLKIPTKKSKMSEYTTITLGVYWDFER